MPRAAQPSRTRRVYWLGLLLNLAAPGSGLTFVGQPVWHAVHVTAVVAVAAFAVLAVSVGAAPVWPAVLVVLGALAASTVHYHLAWRARTTRTGTPTDDGWRWALIATHALAGLALIVGGTVTSLVPRLTNERDRAQQALRSDWTHEVYVAALAASALGRPFQGDCLAGVPGFPVNRLGDVRTCTTSGASEPHVVVVFADGASYSLP